MKIASIILATYILLLTAQPVVSALGSVLGIAGTECCSSGSCESSHKNKNTENTGHTICNPFMICNLCCGYFINDNSYRIFKFRKQQVQLPVWVEMLHSDFHHAFFQPPELI